MYSLEMIRQINDAAAEREAAQKGCPALKPRRIHTQAEIDLLGQPGGPTFPYVGDRVPDDFRAVDSLFCDTTGWGRPEEPALTVAGLKAALQVGYWYGVTEFGQFQCHLGVFIERSPSGQWRLPDGTVLPDKE